MAFAKFRAIIFDIGRVLIRVDVSRAMAGLASGLQRKVGGRKLSIAVIDS